MDKIGFIRMIEATIAVMIILGALLVISSNKEVGVVRDLTETLPPFLDEVAQDVDKRREIIQDYDTDLDHTQFDNALILEGIEQFLRERIKNDALEIEVRICDLEVVCFLKREPYPDTEIFTAERAISATLDPKTNFSPRKLKIFLWKRE